MVDVTVDRHIETQLRELNATLDEIGRLHGRLRARHNAAAAACASIVAASTSLSRAVR